MGRPGIITAPAVLVLTLIASGAGAQTVLVEDFETPDTGDYITFSSGQNIVTATNTWDVTTNSVDLYEDASRPEAAAFDGSQAVDLTGSPGEGVIETSFATVPGTHYTLIFHYARNDLLGAAVGMAQVDVLGAGSLLQAQVQHDPGAQPFDAYLEYSGTFTANSTQTILRFTGLNPGVAGVTIDGISVVASESVPALPRGAQVAVGSGLLLLAALHVKRRRAAVGGGVPEVTGL